ncbi:MAG: PIN domain-containing protein [Nanoarchaeota archaeon]|nr:PIN domain-containing protein [Nanoarchaeota archaeon]
MSVYFYDTYALAKIVLGDEKYRKYDQFDIVTSKLNLMELYLFMLRNKIPGPKSIYEMFEESTVDIQNEDVFQAIKLKLKNKNISYVDVVGYILSKKHKVKFLTGDKAFKGMPNVEFVV